MSNPQPGTGKGVLRVNCSVLVIHLEIRTIYLVPKKAAREQSFDMTCPSVIPLPKPVHLCDLLARLPARQFNVDCPFSELKPSVFLASARSCQASFYPFSSVFI